MGNAHFERHESVPKSDCFFLESGWFWKMQMKQATYAKFYLVDGAGLVGESNTPGVVPNSDAAFSGKTGQENKRTVEIYGLSKGVSLIAWRQNGAGEPVMNMQIEVLERPGHKDTFVQFSEKTAAMNASDLPNFYQLDFNKTIAGGPPEKLFESVPSGTKHVVLATHGQMAFKGTDGITLFIAGNLTRSNCKDAFTPLKAKADGGVVWIGGCEAGSDNDFCKTAAVASGCYFVAPMITLPAKRSPKGMIDWFADSKIKFFDRDGGAPMKPSDFMPLQKKLGWKLVTP